MHRFTKILILAQCHLEPGMNRDKLADTLSRYWIYKPEHWDHVSDKQLDLIAGEVKAIVMAHRTGVL